ncbi:MAG: class I SAM-dependent methyltransferase [Candidatus Moranbacteria bacterium]|nr:class I SAM-dependent methyltransferase [Candidatus Moranbacteria bacterium]
MGYYNSLYIAVKTEISQRINRREELRILQGFIQGLSGTVIEIGCNAGYLTGKIALVGNVTHAIGIDTNKSRAVAILAKIRNLGSGVKFMYGVSGAKIPVEDRSVDAIVLSHVLEHFVNPTEILADISRVLKRDGQLVVAVPKEKYLGEFTPDHKILFRSLADLERILDANGFKAIEAREIARAIVVVAKSVA